MANTLANLKACVPEFDPEAFLDEGINTERRWKQWLENFECCMTFEGVADPDAGPSKKRAAILAIGGQKLRELFSTLTPDSPSYDDATKALTEHFTSKKNLTAERYKFFCTKPLDQEETHDHWVTRLRTKVKDCEFARMDDNEAIKLVLTLHTHSEKLQSAIIQKDMDLTKVVATARALELTKRELHFMKNNQFDSTPVDSIKEWRRPPRENQPPPQERNRNKNRTFEICRYCGDKTPHVSRCKARGATCNHCGKKGHFEKVCESKERTTQKPINTVDTQHIDNVQQQGHQNRQYPSTNVTVHLNEQAVTMKVDSGAGANIISATTYEKLEPKPTLRPSNSILRPYGSPPLKQLGEFEATIQANRKATKATIHVTKACDTKSLMSKFTAFDLGILKITIDDQPVPINIHTVEHTNQNDNQISINDVEHLDYNDMAEHLTPQKTSDTYLKQLSNMPQATKIQKITEKHDAVFKGIGKHKYRQVHLLIDPDIKPIIQPQRKIPFAKREKLDTILDELEDSGVIEPVDGPTDWISNLVLTPKADPNQLRMNVDMTTANTAIRRTRHVIPTTEELRYKLNGAQHFSKLDMKQGYMQMELDADSRPITTFYTHRGLRRSRRLAFGINSAAEVFHEEIHQTLSDIPNVQNIYDDIIVYGSTEAEHNQALCRVLQRLNDCNLTLNHNKCTFDVPKIEFFGVIFSKEGMSPSPEKTQALDNASKPTNTAEVRSFLGMANFSSHFIPEYSTTTAPLRALTIKNARFIWSKECDDAFNLIRTALSQEPVMTYFDPARKTKVIVDGSKKTGLSSVLTQQDPATGQYKVVRYDSRSTTPQEQRYSQIEIESAAVEFAITKNHIYLYGLPEFTVITDHKPLLPLYSSYRTEPPPRILKHKIKLQGYNFTLQYQPGGAANSADYLSRHTTKHIPPQYPREMETEKFINAIIDTRTLPALTIDEIKNAMSSDPDMQTLMTAVETGFIPTAHRQKLAPYQHILKELTATDNLILRGTCILIPPVLQHQAAKLAHEGHQGLVKTKQYARSRIWFPGMDKNITAAVEECLQCQAATNTTQAEPLKMTQLPDGPWEHVRADLFGPLPSKEHVLVVQCLYSRFPAVEIVHSTSAAAIIPAMDKIMTNFGIPYKLGTDNGPPFNGGEFTNFSKQMGFRHTKVTPYAPWANGTVEHFMRNLGKVLKTSNIEGSSWKTALQTFLRSYRATPHATTGQPPAKLMFNGRDFKTRLPSAVDNPTLIDHQTVKHRDAEQKSKQKERADKKKHAKPQNLHRGDKVLCRQRQTNKTMTPYDPNPYLITDIKGSQITARNQHRTITRHITFFKPLKTPHNQERHNMVRRPQSPIYYDTDTEAELTDEGESEPEVELTDDDETIPYEGESDQMEDVPATPRPQRQRRMPARYRDS